MWLTLKNKILRWAEAELEIRASLAMVIDPMEKVEMYEFPYGDDSKDNPIDPDYLVKIHGKIDMDKKTMVDLHYIPGKPPAPRNWELGRGGRW